jgi:16S rRNA (cytosine967-C5)-methyltransferase
VAARALTPGGTLVYSTCTISRPENERQIQTFLDRNPELEPIDLSARFPFWCDPRGGAHLLALPHVQGSDGFFIAAFRRRER